MGVGRPTGKGSTLYEVMGVLRHEKVMSEFQILGGAHITSGTNQRAGLKRTLWEVQCIRVGNLSRGGRSSRGKKVVYPEPYLKIDAQHRAISNLNLKS